jgi:glyoxylase-like metal-dependent hydrolase (beta-lactamase superfamily II)
MVNHKSVGLATNFYCYVWQGRGNNCNTILLCYILPGEQPHVLIDPGHIKNEMGESCFNSLTGAMDKDGFKVEDVGLVIGTHCHPDHFEAIQPVVDRSGALVALSGEEDQFYSDIGSRFYDVFGASAPQVKPFFHLKEGDLSLGARGNVNGVKVLLTPGHTPGSISLYLEEEKILVSGDVVFAGSVGRTDFPGGSPSLLRKSIDRLALLDVEYLVPGHSVGSDSIVAGKDKVARNFQMVRMFV